MEGLERTQCKVCGIDDLPVRNLQSHLEGKKHIANQNVYNREHLTIFVSGTDRFHEDYLAKIFTKFGIVVRVEKFQKNFSFIQFKDEFSVEAAIKARVFAGHHHLFVKRHRGLKQQHSKKRKMSDSSAKDSESFGLSTLPIKFEDPENRSDEQDIFDCQVSQFLSQVELPDESYKKLAELTRHLQQVFSEALVPGCQVLIFGSCSSTLAFKGSDVDLFLQYGEEGLDNFVRKAAKVLRRFMGWSIGFINAIPKARVPIVKFYHNSTGFQCDLTAKSKLGVCNTGLIRFLISIDERLRPLMMLIKYWGKVCGICIETSDHTTFTCYSLVILVIFYLQQCNPPIIPPIEVLQKLAEHQEFAQGWECSFCDELWKVESEYPMEKNKMTVKELLLGFFQYYLAYDFTKVICPLLGKPIPAADFDSIETLPEGMGLYKASVMNASPDQSPELFRTNVMVKTQDPFELALNITRNVSDSVFFRFQNALKYSLKIANTTEDPHFLQGLLSIDKDTLDPLREFSKFNINANKKKVDESWFQLQITSITVVLERILKFKVEESSDKHAIKIQKLEKSEDVHTPPNQTKPEVLIYTCTGKRDLWTSRVKVSKQIKKQLPQPFTDFEKEFHVSNALYNNPHTIVAPFLFQIEVASFHQQKRIQVVLKNKTDDKSMAWKNAANFLKHSFRNLISYAESYIFPLSKCSDFKDIEDNLRELLKNDVPTPNKFTTNDVNLTDSHTLQKHLTLPNLDKAATVTNRTEDKILNNQKLLLKSLSVAENNDAQTNPSTSFLSIDECNQNNSSDEPMMNTNDELEEIKSEESYKTGSSAEKTVRPDPKSIFQPSKTFSELNPPHEILQSSVENNGTITKEPQSREETENQSNRDRETKENHTYSHCIVREATNVQNMTNAGNVSFAAATQPHNVQDSTQSNAHQESNEIHHSLHDSSKPSTYSGFNPGQDYRRQPSNPQESADYKHPSGETLAEKQNQ